MREPWKRPGRYYLQQRPSARAMASIKAKIRERTHRRYAPQDLEIIMGSLNPVLRGWGAYSQRGSSNRKFQVVDSYVRQRMARLASIRHGLRGINWTTRWKYEWLRGLGAYQLCGTVSYWSAHARR